METIFFRCLSLSVFRLKISFVPLCCNCLIIRRQFSRKLLFVSLVTYLIKETINYFLGTATVKIITSTNNSSKFFFKLSVVIKCVIYDSQSSSCILILFVFSLWKNAILIFFWLCFMALQSLFLKIFEFTIL